jgi:hypothetical protein
VLLGVEYWEPLIEFMRSRLIAEGTISPDDMDLLFITDDPAEAVAHASKAADLKPLAPKPSPLLAETS